jgi:hypothetical protein
MTHDTHGVSTPTKDAEGLPVLPDIFVNRLVGLSTIHQISDLAARELAQAMQSAYLSGFYAGKLEQINKELAMLEKVTA